mmetsp:Transcript_26617/g.45176  ORF Transcript_26617/g.45176 Transcript_26617/m.45176 type:complete len:220 (-) Transcript_26617:469-1128(-)
MFRNPKSCDPAVAVAQISCILGFRRFRYVRSFCVGFISTNRRSLPFIMSKSMSLSRNDFFFNLFRPILSAASQAFCFCFFIASSMSSRGRGGSSASTSSSTRIRRLASKVPLWGCGSNSCCSCFADPMMMGGCLRRSCSNCCLGLPVPATTSPTGSVSKSHSFFVTCAVCTANSLEGTTMRAWKGTSGLRRWIVGRTKARVLPDPVSAWIRTSLPASAA